MMANGVGESGSVAGNLVAQRMLDQRGKIAAEILETERTYVEGLGVIEKLFISPLLASAAQHGAILTRKEVRQLFANFPDIISLSRELLGQLEARIGPLASPGWDAGTGRVGDIFLRIAPFLKMYSLYLRNFRSALADISRWLVTKQAFSRFIQQTNSRPECRGLTFQSYLLLPVQRIPRYKLLLEDLLKNTAGSHVDHESIGDALRTIGEVAAFVNENIQEHEMALSIIEIQRTLGMKETLLVPGRRLVKVGTLTKICRKNHQARQFYLFSDILLYSSSAAGGLADDQSGHRKVALEECKVMNVPDAQGSRNQFTIISREKSFIVYAGTSYEKAEWMLALTRAVTERREARSTLQMDNSLRRRMARARRSTMQQFPRVAENFDAPVWDPDCSSERCYICFGGFTLFVRRHHCRACGKIVCNACSRKNIVFVGGACGSPTEGRGCDQCIARLFGREALSSPQGTLHRLLTRSRHSLDPGALLQSLSALTVGGGGLRGHHMSTARRPSAPWTGGIGTAGAGVGAVGVEESAEESVVGEAGSVGEAAGGMGQAGAMGQAEDEQAEESGSPLPASNGSSSAAASPGEWGSARSTVLYEPAQSSLAAAGARVSLVSSSCSTIVSDSPDRPGRVRVRRPVAFMAGDAGGGGSGAQPQLVSQAAPPKLTAAVAEGAVRGGGAAQSGGTVCSLCHGDFTLRGPQHQCSSCLSLVCSKCIGKRQPAAGPGAVAGPDALAASRARMSMYAPAGYQHGAAGAMCSSCTASRGVDGGRALEVEI
ncbi:hypothetical protein GGI04_000263 [Coemansia thaxteri]|nr:hypothetical protein GGI04_000263 [Coemansia thaxteri]